MAVDAMMDVVASIVSSYIGVARTAAVVVRFRLVWLVDSIVLAAVVVDVDLIRMTPTMVATGMRSIEGWS